MADERTRPTAGDPGRRLSVDLARQVATVFLPSTATRPHAQWGVAVAVALDGQLEVEDRAGTARGRVVVVPAGELHQVTCAGPYASIFLDADAHGLTRLAAARGRSFTVDAGVRTPTSPDDLWALARATLPTGPRRIAHPVVRDLAAAVLRGEEVRLERFAASRGLSTSSLSEHFTAGVGLPFRRWVRWRRLLAALPLIEAGRISGAAAAAGFADHAHLTRTCIATFGYTPTRVAGAAVPGRDLGDHRVTGVR